MSSNIGTLVRVTVFGESHGAAVGAVIDGLPAGFKIDFKEITRQMERRAPGNDPTATARKESDVPNVISGVLDGVTTGAPITVLIENNDTQSKDYADTMHCPRPSHADYTGHVRYGGYADRRGGGMFSARLTAPLLFCGSLCMQLLAQKGIRINAHILNIGGVWDTPFDPCAIKQPQGDLFRLLNMAAEAGMRRQIEDARRAQDSVGGIIECAATGLPAGIGAPLFDSVESTLSKLLFSIPAVKGVGFGAGFDFARLRGSEANDPMQYKNGEVITLKNNNGGVLGGITNGAPVVFRVAVKPTPSIAQPQQTVNLETKENTEITIKGRHDPCVVPRALPVIEAAAALGLADLMKEAGKL